MCHYERPGWNYEKYRTALIHKINSFATKLYHSLGLSSTYFGTDFTKRREKTRRSEIQLTPSKKSPPWTVGSAIFLSAQSWMSTKAHFFAWSKMDPDLTFLGGGSGGGVLFGHEQTKYTGLGLGRKLGTLIKPGYLFTTKPLIKLRTKQSLWSSQTFFKIVCPPEKLRYRDKQRHYRSK